MEGHACQLLYKLSWSELGLNIGIDTQINEAPNILVKLSGTSTQPLLLIRKAVASEQMGKSRYI